MPKLSVLSWNVACSKFDAKHTKLLARLHALRDLLVATVLQRKADVVLLQDVRNTGDLSAGDVVLCLRDALGGRWRAQLVAMDGRSDGSHLAVLWNTTTCKHRVLVIPQLPGVHCEGDSRKWVAAHFEVLSDVSAGADVPPTIRNQIGVLNTQAPTRIAHLCNKESYWDDVFGKICKNTVCFGDMNKFSRHMDSYNTHLYKNDLVDHVKPDQVTFHSLDYDRNQNGEPYVDSWDAVITKQDSAVRVMDVDTVSTAVKHESDHYIVCATLEFE